MCCAGAFEIQSKCGVESFSLCSGWHAHTEAPFVAVMKRKPCLKYVAPGRGTNKTTYIYSCNGITLKFRDVRYTFNQESTLPLTVTQRQLDCEWATKFLAVTQSGVVSPVRITETLSYIPENLLNRTSPQL